MRADRFRRPACVLLAAVAALGSNPAEGRPLPDQDSAPDRGLAVRVAVPPDLQRQRGWFGEFQCATSRASRALESALGKSLRIQDRVSWRGFSGEDDLYALRSELIRNVDHGGADLVVGLIPTAISGRDLGSRIVEDGLAAYSQGYVVLRVGAEICETGQLLAHEIAHVFGGIHRRGSGNLMDPLAPGEAVDELNAALFDLHRDRSIREQAPPLHGEMLRMMWRLAGAEINSADTWLKVGVLAATMDQPSRAAAYYGRALEIDAQLRVAWVNLGHAYLQSAQFRLAERAYREALDLGPNDGLVHNNLAVVYMSLDRPHAASSSVDKALALGYPVSELFREAIRKAIGGGAPR